MATTTSAFGWTIPQSTDYVKDGATAIATLGNGIDSSLKRHGCVVTHNVSQSINTGVIPTVALAFNTEILDTDAYHSTAVNTSRITIPAGLAGVYSVFGYCRWDDVNATLNPIVIITLNAVAVNRFQSVSNTTFTPTPIAWTGYCAVGDYLELRVYHTTVGAPREVEYVAAGGANTLDPRSPVFGAFRVGGPA